MDCVHFWYRGVSGKEESNGVIYSFSSMTSSDDVIELELRELWPLATVLVSGGVAPDFLNALKSIFEGRKRC